jgi:predicted nucleic acid-binding protein
VIVLDANVAAKWYLPERGTEAAVELMTGPLRLFAPDLIRLEVLSAITRRVRVGEATSAEAAAQCQRWLDYLSEGGVVLIPEADVLANAVKLSMKVKHPLFDCLYLAAAHQLDAPILTADRPFFDRVKPFHKKISMLAGCENN